MEEMNRRRLIKGIVSMPLVLASSKFASASEYLPEPEPSLLWAPPTLHVFLHGLMTVVVRQDGLEILIPRRYDPPWSHIYKAADYDSTTGMNEPMQNKYSYFLTGVTPGNAPDPTSTNNNAVVHTNKSKVDFDPYALRQCRLLLPFPTKFNSLRCKKRKDQGTFFSGNDATLSGINVTSLALVHVLSYELKQGDSPRIECRNEKGDKDNPLSWAPWAANPSLSLAKLHIYAQPQQEPALAHAITSFDEMMKLFPKTWANGEPLDLHFKSYDDKLSAVDCKLPDGITDSDLDDLAEHSGAGAQGANCVKLFVVTP